MRTFSCLFAIVLSAAASASAQGTAATAHDAGICYHARAKSGCSAFWVTDAGLYRNVARDAGAMQGVVDWGLMVNVSSRDAIGVSWFGLADVYGTVYGPSVRYRRWLGRAASLDVALGTNIGGATWDAAANVYGLVKWNPVHWFSVAARQQWVQPGAVAFSSGGRPTEGRFSLGVELGWFPGLVTSVLPYVAWVASPH